MALAVDIADGVVQINGAAVAVAEDTLDIGLADATDSRFDLVVVDDTGTVSIVEGTLQPNPVYPAIPADTVVLAVVYVPATLEDLASGNIIDKRVMVERRNYIEMGEIADPGVAPANAGRIWFEDDGAGKTRLVVRFPSGTAQVIKTEV